jgi:hypothetical protein
VMDLTHCATDCEWLSSVPTCTVWHGMVRYGTVWYRGQCSTECCTECSTECSAVQSTECSTVFLSTLHHSTAAHTQHVPHGGTPGACYTIVQQHIHSTYRVVVFLAHPVFAVDEKKRRVAPQRKPLTESSLLLAIHRSDVNAIIVLGSV